MFHVVPPSCEVSAVYHALVCNSHWSCRRTGCTNTLERQIRPILRECCFDCHGATEKKEGNFALRLVCYLSAGGVSGAAIDLDAPQESLLLQHVVGGEMPPGEGHLPADKIELLQRWLAAGAKTERPEPDQIGHHDHTRGSRVLGFASHRSAWQYQSTKKVPDAFRHLPPISRNLVMLMWRCELVIFRGSIAVFPRSHITWMIE